MIKKLLRIAHLGLVTIHCGGFTISVLGGILSLLKKLSFWQTELFVSSIAYIGLLCNILIGIFYSKVSERNYGIRIMCSFGSGAVIMGGLYIFLLYQNNPFYLIFGILTLLLLVMAFLSYELKGTK